MKSLLTLVLLTVNMICYSAKTDPKPSNTLTLEGKYIAEMNVQCQVYMVMADSTLDLVSESRSLKRFNISLEVGEEYLIKFISNDGQVKYLYVVAPENGWFMFDVDFHTQDCATLKYNKKSKQYRMTHVRQEQLVYANMENTH